MTELLRNSIDSDFIEIGSVLDFYQCERAKTHAKFKKEIVKLARWMAKIRREKGETKLPGAPTFNKPLRSVLIKAMQEVHYYVIKAAEKEGEQNSENAAPDFFFYIGNKIPVKGEFLQRPQFNNLILPRDERGNSYIPLDGALIPLVFGKDAVDFIGGSLGKNIREAFHEGMRDVANPRHWSKPRIRREADIAKLDKKAIEEGTQPDPDVFQLPAFGPQVITISSHGRKLTASRRAGEIIREDRAKKWANSAEALSRLAASMDLPIEAEIIPAAVLQELTARKAVRDAQQRKELEKLRRRENHLRIAGSRIVQNGVIPRMPWHVRLTRHRSSGLSA